MQSILSKSPDCLALLWHELVAGDCFLLETFCTDHRCFATFQRARPPLPLPNERDADVLRRVLIGEAPKVVAGGIERSASMVTTYAIRCLARMGVDCTASRAPLVLVMAAHAASGARLPSARVAGAESAPGATWVLSVERPDNHLPDALSKAEQALVRMVMEGQSYAEMAKRRSSALRTIANQLGSIFRKLSISGRGELSAWVIRRHEQLAMRVERVAGEPLHYEARL